MMYGPILAIFSATVFALFCSDPASALAEGHHQDVRYALDQLADHPYRFPPAYGHAGQVPGSPKYFVPAYGYRIPGFGFRAGYSQTLYPYAHYYRFGRRVPGNYGDREQRFWTNSYGGPWYYPGSSINTRTAWPSW